MSYDWRQYAMSVSIAGLQEVTTFASSQSYLLGDLIARQMRQVEEDHDIALGLRCGPPRPTPVYVKPEREYCDCCGQSLDEWDD